MVKPVKAALIGSGVISGIYLKNMTQVFNSIVDVVGCSDLIPERAERRAKEYGIKVLTNEQIFNDPEIEMVINTTYMQSHYPVSKAALMAGKHVWTEKCVSLTRDMGRELKELAESKGLLIGGAPDTYMGAGMQTAINLIDKGMIGEPLAVKGVMIRGGGSLVRGLEQSPSAELNGYAGRHSGIMHDVGVYYIINMIALFGPIKRVAAFYTKIDNEVTFKNPANPKFGQTVPIEAPTTLTINLEFESGKLGTLVVSRVGVQGELPMLDVIGTEGVVYCGDCNMYWGPVRLMRENGDRSNDSTLMPFTHNYIPDTRGIGAADFAYAIRNGRKPRGSADLIFHTLDVLDGILESADSGEYYNVPSTCDRPRPLRSGLKLGAEVFDD